MRANIGVCLPTSISIFALVTSAALSRSVKVPNTPTYGNTCTFAALNHPAVPFYQWFHSHLAQIQLACRIRSSCANGTSTPHWWLCTMRRRWIDHDGLLPFVRNRSFSSGVFRGSSTAIRLLWGGRQSDGRRREFSLTVWRCSSSSAWLARWWTSGRSAAIVRSSAMSPATGPDPRSALLP